MHIIALLVALLGTLAAAHDLSIDPHLVDFYSPAREDSLLPQPSPVLAEYTRDDHHFGFAGVVHSSDPASPTFRLLDRAFATIRPKVVILEGFPTSWGANPPRIVQKLASAQPASSYDSGEDMYAARLANKSGAAIWGGEIGDSELAAELRAVGFKSRDIFFASMFGPLAQDREAKVFDEPDGPAFEKSYSGWAEENAKSYDPSAPTSAAAFKEWFRKNYGRSLSEDAEWFTRGGPGQSGIAGQIGRASNRIRDEHMFSLAMTMVQANKPVLLVAGRSHLTSQWRALEAAMGQPRLSYEPETAASKR